MEAGKDKEMFDEKKISQSFNPSFKYPYYKASYKNKNKKKKRGKEE